MQFSDALEMMAQRLSQSVRQDGDAFTHPFALSHNDMAGSEVDVFDTKAQGFHETKAASVKKLGQEAVIAMQLGDDRVGFTSAEDHGHFGRAPHALDASNKRKFAIQHLLVKKEERAKGLVLS